MQSEITMCAFSQTHPYSGLQSLPTDPDQPVFPNTDRINPSSRQASNTPTGVGGTPTSTESEAMTGSSATNAGSRYTSKREVLKLRRQEKGILLGCFLSHSVAQCNGEEWKQKCDLIVEEMRSNAAVRAVVREKLTTTHVETYKKNYAQPLISNGGAAMPYIKDDNGVVVLDSVGSPQLDTELIDQQDRVAPGTKEYWLNLVEYDKKVREGIRSSEQGAEQSLSEAVSQRQSKKDKQAEKRKQYHLHVQKLRKKRRKIESRSKRLDGFKVAAMQSTIRTQQQNAMAFHAISSAYCSRNNCPPPPPLTLPTVPESPFVGLVDSDTSDSDTSEGDKVNKPEKGRNSENELMVVEDSPIGISGATVEEDDI